MDWRAGPAFSQLLRSIPGLIWGVIYVAAVGFGPLPGILALATHSTGMLGKFFAETMEHVDPGPGNALRSHGVSRLGIYVFSSSASATEAGRRGHLSLGA